jgi:hypothetical protein
MTVNQRKREQDNERDRLLRHMDAAKARGDRQDINNALAEAKHWLKNNYVGDNSVRKAQVRLLGVFPPEH